MHTAHARAAAQLGCTAGPGPHAWGHGARTLGGPVTTPAGPAWLRVLETPPGKTGGKLWTGTAQADHALPPSIPRPRLLDALEWATADHAYRAELTTLDHRRSKQSGLTGDTDLTPEWGRCRG